MREIPWNGDNMKKLLALLIIFSVLSLSGCKQKGITVEQNDEYTKITLDNFKGCETVKIPRTPKEGALYYKTDITKGSISSSYDLGIFWNTEKLVDADENNNSIGGGYYIDGSTSEISIIIEAEVKTSGEIYIGYKSFAEREPLVLDPGLHKDILTDEYIQSLFEKDYTEIDPDPRWLDEYADAFEGTDWICITNRCYEYRGRLTQIYRDENGNVISELVSVDSIASFYSDDDGNVRMYREEADLIEGVEDTVVIEYRDEKLDRAYYVKHWTTPTGIVYGATIEPLHPFDVFDGLVYNLFPAKPYGYAEDGEYYYFHLVFTQYGSPDVDYDIYYQVDSDFNITAMYMRETVGTENSSYQTIREGICIPYDSYFDLPEEIYG